MNQSMRLCFASLLLLLVASVASAQTDIYLYDQDVVGDVNLGVFLEDGEVEMADGSRGEGAMKWVFKGPAPAPYPQVQVWETDIERLGPSSIKVNGVRFINHGTHWGKNKKALVLWHLEIPNASSRMASEFEKDLTFSFWVDWNQDQMWNKTEKMILEHINLQNYFPTSMDVVHVYYLTSFRVPDVDAMTSSKKPDTPEMPGNDKGVAYLWTRGIVSYDDPDVSPDGEQLFGEIEDYRVTYMMTPRGASE